MNIWRFWKILHTVFFSSGLFAAFISCDREMVSSVQDPYSGKCAECAGCGPARFRLYQPIGGETYRVGDTLTIRACSIDPDDPAYNLEEAVKEVSFDSGANWIVLNNDITIGQQANWFDWIIPDSVGIYDWVSQDIVSLPTTSDQCLIRISAYNIVADQETDSDLSDAVFSITAK